MEGKGGRCVGLTPLPHSYADCLEIWEPRPPGTLRACPGIAVTFSQELELQFLYSTSGRVASMRPAGPAARQFRFRFSIVFSGSGTHSRFLHKSLFALHSSHTALLVPISVFPIMHRSPSLLIKIAP
jgi:hypothetical protein